MGKGGGGAKTGGGAKASGGGKRGGKPAAVPNLPSTTGKPSGGGRGNAPPKR